MRVLVPAKRKWLDWAKDRDEAAAIRDRQADALKALRLTDSFGVKVEPSRGGGFDVWLYQEEE